MLPGSPVSTATARQEFVTTFDYGNLAASANAVDLDLANTGTMAGAEAECVLE